MKKFITSVFLTASFILAQGEFALPFLMIAPNAHNAGIGEAGGAYPESASAAMHYNIAGLAYYDKYGDTYGNKSDIPVDFSYGQWLPELNFNDLYYVYAASKFNIEDLGVFGAAIRFMNYGEIIKKLDENDPGEPYNALDLEINVGYSMELLEDLFVGASTKFIYSKIVESNTDINNETANPGTSVAFDLGFYQLLGDLAPFFKDARVGVSWNNIGPSISYVDNSQEDPLPMHLRGSIAGHLYEDESSRLRFIYDLGIFTIPDAIRDHTGTEILSRFMHSGGFEFIYDNVLAARFGGFLESSKFGDRKFFTVGIGFNAEFMVVDASYLIAYETEHPLAGTPRFSFRFNL
jgi:hypothetical protein